MLGELRTLRARQRSQQCKLQWKTFLNWRVILDRSISWTAPVRPEPLKDRSADTWALIEKAETFIFAGSRYNRAEFEKVLDRMIAKPGHAQQLS